MLGELVQDHDGLFVSSGAAEPARLIEELLSDVAPRRNGLQLFQVLTASQGRLFNVVHHGHRLRTPAPGPLRGEVATGKVELVDLSMRQCARAIEDEHIPVDGVLLTAVRSGDTLWPVPATDLAMVAFERARFRAVEVLPDWDRAPSGPHFPLSDVDYCIEGDGGMPELRPAEKSDTSRRIGELIAELIPPGAAIELGVGRALASVAECLVEAGRPLAVHSGLVSDWTRELVEQDIAALPLACASGKPVSAAVAMGSRSFYEWLKHTDAVEFAESRHAHDPGHLMTLRPFVAVNSAMAVDLSGRVGLARGVADVNASGGLLDYATAGAYAGASVIAITSTSTKGHSRIVADLGTVHLPAGFVTHVVSEHGIADLRGRSGAERRLAMLQVAHPNHREQLRTETA